MVNEILLSLLDEERTVDRKVALLANDGVREYSKTNPTDMEYMPKVEQKLNFLGVKYQKMETPKRYIIQLVDEPVKEENEELTE
ncbi:hypothetical protein AALM16_19995 [Bacteroides caccae]|uniref:hypothetical protein n=1 Tax=Bacteria TaxID=2 RepID=UPI0035143CDA